MKFEDMSIEELEAFRDELQQKMEALKAEFVEAGKVMDVKRSLESGNVEDDLERAEKEVIRLRNLKSKAEALNLKGSK